MEFKLTCIFYKASSLDFNSTDLDLSLSPLVRGLVWKKMVIMLSIQGITYVKSAKILIANLVKIKSGHQTSLLTQWRCESSLVTLPTICRL